MYQILYTILYTILFEWQNNEHHLISYLPLSHIAALFLDLIGPLCIGVFLIMQKDVYGLQEMMH